MADIYQAKADNLRATLLKGAINKLGKELQEIEHVALANAKEPAVFTKVKLDLPLDCEVCNKPHKGYTILDSYNFYNAGNYKGENTRIVCKACAKKIKVKLW